jgi:hypothetical protein
MKERKQKSPLDRVSGMFEKNPMRFSAERVGFEPTIPLPVYHLSRVASSTAPAPLQLIKKKYNENDCEMQFANEPNHHRLDLII